MHPIAAQESALERVSSGLHDRDYLLPNWDKLTAIDMYSLCPSDFRELVKAMAVRLKQQKLEAAKEKSAAKKKAEDEAAIKKELRVFTNLKTEAQIETCKTWLKAAVSLYGPDGPSEEELQTKCEN